MSWRALAVAVTTAVLAAAGARASGATPAAGGCRTPTVDAAYAGRVAGALRAGRDIWGERLLTSPGGPTLAAARRFLPPLLYAGGHGGTRLTASGVYYLPFTLPISVGGARGFGLHVADGSEVIVRRVGGASLRVGVGSGGGERFGSCIARLGTPALAEGYLPILEVSYRDWSGARYREESFVGRLGGAKSLVSFVRVYVDASLATKTVTVRLRSSRGRVARASFPRGGSGELDAAFVHDGGRLLVMNADAYASTRASVVSFWRQHLAEAASFEVPEEPVVAAERAILLQELELTWRYSVGNAYEELSYAESLDVAQVMAAFGYGDVARQILRFASRRLPVRFTNWRAGERLVAGAQYFRLTGDRRFVAEETPGLATMVDGFARELAASGNGLLPRERYSSDIPTQIYSLQGQTVVWQGLLAMSRVWAATGHPALARRSRVAAVRLERGLRRAVRSSARRLPDGSLFVPAALLDGGAPFQRLSDTRDGTYWNLVAPYAFASGFFGSRTATSGAIERYLMLHGSRLLGLVRAGVYRLGGGGGTDQVYGVNVARFLADEDDPDQLVLSLYGTLAAALTPGTYVTGESASVAPLDGQRYRTMYLPPNNGGAAAFLETLRLMLVHETRGRAGAPTGLELAYATPRAWLEDGKRIAVRDAPTSFGPVSYSIERRAGVVAIAAHLPSAVRAASLHLRLRLPRGERVKSATLLGRPLRVDAVTGTIDLSGRSGDLQVTVTLRA
ncbi:MAG: hypothetical protein ACJ76I_03420 [Gaiellaceae bacterium]